MRIAVGTSGYSYKEWKGSFYPEDLPAAKMLRYYAERFPTVEINNTFYRMPSVTTIEQWGRQVPDSFTFVLKAPQRITHQKRLVDAAEDVRFFFDAGRVLGSRFGAALFQLPPFARKDVVKLASFIDSVPDDVKVAFEFRHDSWFDDEVYDLLRKRSMALCMSDTDEVADPDRRLVPTASWGYLRLRRTEYPEGALERWAERLKAQPWERAFVYLKHEDEGKGPRFAKELERLLQ